MTSLTRHARYGLRLFFKQPGTFLIAVLTLAVGIGANTAIFSVVSALVFPPLPTSRPDGLAMVRSTDKRTGAVVMGTSEEEFSAWQARSRAVERFAGFTFAGSTSVTEGGATEPTRALRASANLLDVLAVTPVSGRNFSSADEKAVPETAILGHELWQRRFGGASDIVGRQIRVDGRYLTVIGVLPQNFDLLGAELILPLGLQPGTEPRRLQVLARLRPGHSLADVQNELAAITASLNTDASRESGVSVVSLREWFGGEFARFGVVLFGAALLVLLVACANVAGLLLARGVERGKEIAVRLAMGATRRSIVLQLMVENTLLAFIGGAVGVLAARWLIDALNATIPPEYRWRFTLDFKALAFALALCAVTTWLSGFFPAWRTSRPHLNQSLKEGIAKSPATHRLRAAFTIGNIALSLFLLVAAGLLTHSLWKFTRIDPGFDPTGITTLWLNFSGRPDSRQNDGERLTAAALERTAALPGVTHVAAATELSLETDTATGLPFSIDGKPPVALPADPTVLGTAVTDDYFATSGMRLTRGRSFIPTDRAVAIVNERLARACFPDGDALGRRLRLAGDAPDRPWLTIVGVTADVRHPSRIELTEIPLDIYVPLAQRAAVFGQTAAAPPLPSVTLIARATGDLDRFQILLPKLIWELAPEQAIQPARHVRTMEERLWRESFEKRGFTLLLVLFAGSALGLAAIGLYGLLAGYFLERRHEFGIRAALGARHTDVMKLIFRQGLKLTLPGIAVGLGLAYAAPRVLQTMLYDLSATDPLTFILAPLFFLGVATVACVVPARRAARVDPATALRCE
jgi:putative ABC transport system permease protein